MQVQNRFYIHMCLALFKNVRSVQIPFYGLKLYELS